MLTLYSAGLIGSEPQAAADTLALPGAWVTEAKVLAARESQNSSDA